MPQIMNEAEQLKEAERQQRFIGEARELVTAMSADLGRPLISNITTFGCQMETEHGTV